MAKKIKTKRKVIPLHELPPKPLAEALRDGTDSSCALICGAYIENALGLLLERVMIDDPLAHGDNGLLNDPRGALGSARARTDMAFCLGLVDKTTYENSKRIGQIRNRFAHSHKPLDFSDQVILGHCSGLEVWLTHPGSPTHCPAEGDTKGSYINPAILIDSAISRRILAIPRYRFVLAAFAAFTAITDVVYLDPDRFASRPVVPIRPVVLETNGKSFLDVVFVLDA